ncbi:MAG: hypothetical protein WA892_00460 [Ornithinimicrobium sp.]
MSDQSVRQAARRVARGAQRRLLAAREEREKRLGELGVQVVVALAERDAAVAEREQAAGAALRSMTEQEGLALRDAVKWCGDGVSVREGSRLRQLATTIDAQQKVAATGPDANREQDGAGPAEQSAGHGQGVAG